MENPVLNVNSNKQNKNKYLIPSGRLNDGI